MKKTIINLVVDVAVIVFTLVVGLNILGLFGAFSYGYRAHTQMNSGNYQTVKEHYVQLFDAEFITNVEVID